MGGSVFFTPAEVLLALVDKKVKIKTEEGDPVSSLVDNSKAVRIEYKNADKKAAVEGLEPLPGVANFMVGSDKKAWVVSAPTYAGIVYRDIYPGIDLQYEGAGNSLKSTFTVAPGADAALIQWSYKDAGEVNLDADGNLLISLPAKNEEQTDTILTEHAPLAWQEQDGQRMNVAVRYALTDNGGISFVFPQGYEPSLPLTIDPTLTYGTYLGQNGTDVGTGIATDSAGNAYVTGYSWCGAFPTVDPIQQGGAGGPDIIISKISADGSALLYSTCVGGSDTEYGSSILVDPQGRIIVSAETESDDFPIVSGIATYGGGVCSSEAPCQDAVILVLNSDGSAIEYSTYLGGDGREEVTGLALDGDGNIIAVGSSTSTNFPTVNAYDDTFGGGTCTSGWPCYDVTVTKIDPDLSGSSAILYSTYLGGNSRDKAYDVTLGSNGNAYLVGYSDSDGYPTRNAFQSTRMGGTDVILSQIDTSLAGDASLIYSTYLGTSSTDSGWAIARDTDGNLYLTGRTASSRFPLRDPLQHLSHAGSTCGSTCYEAFVTKLDITTNTLAYSTYLGGSHSDEGYGIVVDPYGRAYVTGYTRSSDFPTHDAIQSTKGGDSCSSSPCADAFLSVLEPDGGAFTYSTFLGGAQDDEAKAVVLDSANNVYIVGKSYSTDFPTTFGAYDRVNTETNKSDAFIVKVGALGAPPPQTSTHLDIPIAGGSEDAEERADGSMYLAGTGLDLVTDGNGSVQQVGLRFTNLDIPQGAVIQDARVQFTAYGATTEATSLLIQAEASDQASTFTSSTNDISSRPKTGASVAWDSIPEWTADHGGPDQRTPNFAAVVQEVVDRPGWGSGNALAVIITGSGRRLAKSFEKDVYGAPYLHIEYTIPAQPTETPTPIDTPTETSTPPSSTPTFTPTGTLTPTHTPTETPTPTATLTFTPTSTGTPIPSGPITITYDYDPLNRLKDVNYSDGTYYSYTYDAVGNRKTQENMVGGLLTNNAYLYDDVNRLIDVDGVEYIWDANGNLLSDGVNSYAYDSANRLATLTGPSAAVGYAYRCNGLSSDQWGIIGCESDRASQTVNGVTTNYVLDIASPLTQVLQESASQGYGTNTYLYGVDRIAQIGGATPEYFLTDGLGSVRQLVDSTGAITLANSYAPYGETISSAGGGVSVYQFTGEARDTIGLTYLRARYLDSNVGRFISRDTWAGNYNSPLSLNRWNYSQSNPINYTDPTGHDRCFNTISSRVSFAEKYVNLSKTDFLNTYTAGGIGVQCYGTDFYKPWTNPDYSGMGIAQISTVQAETKYGVNIVIGGGNYGSGLRCYIRIGDRDNQICSICLTKAELDKMNESQRKLYSLEPVLDQKDPTSAVIMMKRRIKAVVDSCRNCNNTDKFIAASLAQNGGGLTPSGMWVLSSEGSAINQNPFREHKTDPIAWDLYFEERYKNNGFRGWFDTYHQLLLFSSVVDKLRTKGWSVPTDLDWVGIRKLANSRTHNR